MTTEQLPPEVSLLSTGFLMREAGAVVDASSSVALVKSANQVLVVDTGVPRDQPKIVSALRSHGLTPRDVKFVVNTHLHMDHIGCNDVFEGARFYAHTLENPPIGVSRITGPTLLFPGVELIPTPGHTAGSISVFVSAERKCVIAGDALPTKANYDGHTPPSVNIDSRLALVSMDMILGWAEVVIPGHGPPFEVLGKK